MVCTRSATKVYCNGIYCLKVIEACESALRYALNVELTIICYISPSNLCFNLVTKMIQK